MATKEEIEQERNELKEENEKLKLRYKEVETKLEVARRMLQVVINHLDVIPDIGYTEDIKEPDFPEPQNEIQ